MYEETETRPETVEAALASSLRDAQAAAQPPTQSLSQDEFQKMIAQTREEAHKALISWGTIKGWLSHIGKEASEESSHIEALIKSKF